MVTDKHLQWLLLWLFLSKQTLQTHIMDWGMDWLVKYLHPSSIEMGFFCIFLCVWFCLYE